MRRPVAVIAVGSIISLLTGCESRPFEPSFQNGAGKILAPIDGCHVLGVWGVERDDRRPDLVRTEVIMSGGRQGYRFEANCADTTYRLTAQAFYDGADAVWGVAELDNKFVDGPMKPVIQQVCALSRSEDVRTFGEFTSVAEFRGLAAETGSEYFAGQRPCRLVRPVGPSVQDGNKITIPSEGVEIEPMRQP